VGETIKQKNEKEVSKLTDKRKGVVSLLFTALMVCAMLVPGAAADGP